MKIVWLILDMIISIGLGFYINLHITSEVIVYFFSGASAIYLTVFFICLIIQILLIFSILRLLRNKKIEKNMFKILSVLYVVIMVTLLFGRQVMGATINFNLLNLFDFTKENILQNILNIIFFLPIGYFIKGLEPNKAIAYSISGILAIEVIQLVTKRGIFDVNDIILNFIGIYFAYYLTNRYNIRLVE